MPEETAVLELPAPAADVEESLPLEAPDQTLEVAPETQEGEASAPESEAALDPFADLDDDALAEHERVKKLVEGRLARERESARRAEEHRLNEQRHQHEVQQYNSVATNQFIGNRIAEARALLGDPEWMPDQPTVQRWQQDAVPFATTGRIVAKQDVVAAANEYLAEVNPEYRVPADMLDEWNLAAAAPDAKPLTKTALKVMLAAALEKERAAIRAEIEAEFNQSNQTESKRASSEARRSAPQPSKASVGAPPAEKNWRAIFEDPESSLAVKEEAYEKLFGRKYGS